MAEQFYKLTNDSTGETMVVCLPDLTDGSYDDTNKKGENKDIGWFTQHIPLFSNAVTMITTTTELKNALKNFGCPLALSTDELNGTKWSFSNGSKIEFTTGGLITYYVPDGTWIRTTVNYLDGVNNNTVSIFSHVRSNIDRHYYAQTFHINSDGTANAPDHVISYYNANIDEFCDKFFANLTPDLPKTDPYEDGGGSTDTGGGTGDFDGTSDSIDIPDLPTLSATDAGFITLYNPTQAQLHSLANYLWSDAFDINTFKKLYADPMSVILGLSIVPVSVPNGGTRAVTVGNRSTGISMNLAASQYVSIDCGTLNVNEFWGGYLDYSPFTEAEIYLPYIGTHPIATDDIMGKSVHVVYHVDILSGACCAYVKCGNSVLYSFIGQCSSSIPISGNDWTNVINGVISIAGSIGSMVATGGMSAPMEIGNIASNAVNASKPNVEKSGALGGTGGMLNVQKPYLILTRPKQAVPAYQNTYTGYPSFITEKFSNLTGYTEVYKTHLENISATDAEISEIESLLKSGVIF